MSSERQHQWPEWARQERGRDLAWIQENLHVLWPAAQQGYQASGRGAIVIDTLSHPAGAGNPFVYLPQNEVAKMEDADASRMVDQYDPNWELVTMLLKSAQRLSTYRVRIPAQRR